jgi:hypothetical protein
VDELARVAQLWSYADSILRSCVAIEAKYDLNPMLLDRVCGALDEFFKATGGAVDRSFENVLREIAELLRAAVEARTDNT